MKHIQRSLAYDITNISFLFTVKEMDLSDPNSGGATRHHILQSVENSLERLKTSYIDLLYVHVFDYGTCIEDTLRALTDVVRSGKVHYIGASNFTGWQVHIIFH